tara:strand:- start:3837 stop:4334 length:498 start_codon:yes stop_codon:yes gene_type:complete
MAYPTTPIAGIDLTATPAGTGTSSNEGNDFPLGMKVPLSDGGEAMFVHANGAITQYDCVGIDEDFEAAAITKAIVDDGHFVGFAQVAFADNDFGWVHTKGSNISCRLAASCAADSVLYTTSTAGVLDDSSSGQTKIDGIVGVGSASAGGIDNVEIIATHPKSTTF